MTNLTKLEKKIGINFNNKDLLLNAFIHRSYLNENKHFRMPSNEQLEFLGDSVLSLATSIYLYKNYPHLREGQYTDIKAYIVKGESLYKAASDLDLGELLMLSRGEEENKGRLNKSILADSFEALIAVIFLDQDFETAYKFIIEFLFKDYITKAVKSGIYLSAKNKLQERIQDKYKKLPVYKVITQSGPEHKKYYKIGVYFNGQSLGIGEGYSKKSAQEEAARNALQKKGI